MTINSSEWEDISAQGAFTINLTGDSTVSLNKEYANENIAAVDTTQSYIGLSTPDQSIAVTGTGSLTVTASAESNANVVGLRAGEDGIGNLTICDSARVIATATNPEGACYGVQAKNISLSDSAVLEGLTSKVESSDDLVGQSWGIECSKLSLADSSKAVGRGCDAYLDSYGITAADSVTVADDATLVATSGNAGYKGRDGYSMGLSGLTLGSAATFTVTSGTVDLESGAAATSYATDLVPKLSGYSSYRWKTAAADELTSSPPTGYVYDKSQTYINIVPTPYDVWVGNVQVTSANMNDVLGDGAVKFTPGTTTSAAMLTLDPGYGNTLSISGVADKHHGAAIASTRDLKILLRNTTTITGASCSTGSAAGIYVEGDLLISGNGTVNATAGDFAGPTGSHADFSAGILATGTVTLGKEEDGNGTYVNATGGTGADKSAGIAALEVLNVTNDTKLVARGADNPDADTIGVYAGKGLTLTENINGSSSTKAYGGTGTNSYGVLVNGSEGVAASANTTLIAQAGDATAESIGIKLASVDDPVSVSGYAILNVSSGASSSAGGTSQGIYGKLVYDATGDSKPMATVTCGTGETSAALAREPELSGTYRWRTDTTSTWQYSVGNPFKWSGSEKSVSLAPIGLGVYVAGTEVTMANKDNVLAGTANDGKVTFVPSTDGTSLGTLFLKGATIDAGALGFNGPGINAEGALTINLAGDNVVSVSGGEYHKEVKGVQTTTAYRGSPVSDGSIAVTGTGSLTITASAPSDYNVVGLRAGEAGNDNLTICDSARVIATATNPWGACYGVQAKNISLSDSAVLEGLTSEVEPSGEPVGQSWGIECSNLSLADSSKVVGHGCDAYLDSYGITAADSVTVADDATLVATSGSAGYEARDGYSMGLSGPTWDSTPTFVVTGGTVDLESGAASLSEASDVAPDLSGYPSYRWKTAAADDLTSSTTAAYVYAKSQTYINIVPPEPEPATPTPTPASGTPATSETSAAAASTPDTGDGMAVPLAAAALLLTGGSILAMCGAKKHRGKS